MLPESLPVATENEFPRFRKEEYRVTSPADWKYNCIAYAAGECAAPWWPSDAETEGVFWPPEAPREETMDAFVTAFKTKGYCPIDDMNTGVEAGYEKIVIYVDAEGTPSHAARQLDSGAWTSKLGTCEDISHDHLPVSKPTARSQATEESAKS
jgi:hypothetical protein